MRVLVVEDDKFTQRLLVSILQKNSFTVDAEVSGKGALSFLEKGEYVDVIVSDIMMPLMDGITFVKHLKSDRRLRRIPVVLCTSLGDEAMVVKGLEAGAVNYIVKPVNESTLMSKIDKAMEKAPGAVLVAADDEVLLNLLTHTLLRDGYRVLTAGTGHQALEMMEKNRVALIIADVKMPGMDGFELLASVKESDFKIPVLLMSGRGEFSRDEVIAAGADDFIAKPLHNTQVLNRIQAHFK